METQILRAIIGRAVEVIGQTLPIHAPGRSFDQKRDAPDGNYFELIPLSFDPDYTTWGSEQKFNGALRVILHWKTDNSGIYSPIAMLVTIKDQMPKGSRFFVEGLRMSITDHPMIGDPDPNGQETWYPLTIPYQAITT